MGKLQDIKSVLGNMRREREFLLTQDKDQYWKGKMDTLNKYIKEAGKALE